MFTLVALIFVSAFLSYRLVLRYPRPAQRHRVIGRADAAFIAAAADTFFPAGSGLPLGGREADLPGRIDAHLASLPRRSRALVRLLFFLFEQSTLIFPAQGVGAFRRFSSMSAEQRRSVLEAWTGSGLYPRRFAFESLKALLVMAYVDHPETLRHLALEPTEIAIPSIEADRLYPPIGQGPDAIAAEPPGAEREGAR